MKNVRRVIFTAVAIVGLMGLTAGTGYSAGSRTYSGETPKVDTGSSVGSATGGTTETLGAGTTPRGLGAHTTVKKPLTVERVSPDMGTGTGGRLGTGAGGTIDQGTGGMEERGTMDRDTGDMERDTGGNMGPDSGSDTGTGSGGTMGTGTGGTGGMDTGEGER